MLDGDTDLVLGAQVWFTLAEQLVLTAEVLVEAPMLNAYLQTQSIRVQLMGHSLQVIRLLEQNMNQMASQLHQTIMTSPVQCVCLLLKPVTCFPPKLLVQMVGLNSIRDT